MELTVANCELVYFNELSSKEPENILVKLTAKFRAAIFSVWVKPPRSSTSALRFEADRVEWRNGELFVNQILKPSLPLRTALIMFHAFLKSARQPVVLVGFSRFSVSRPFLANVQKTQLVDLFHGVIGGFSNGFDVWRKTCHNRVRNAESINLYFLSELYLRRKRPLSELDTTFIVTAISELAVTIPGLFNFVKYRECYEEAFTKLMNTPNGFRIYKGLNRLLSCLPEVVARKMAAAGFSYQSLKLISQSGHSEGFREFLTAQLNTFVPELSPAESNDIVANVVGFFEEQNRRGNEDGSSSGGRQRGTGHQSRSTLSAPTSSRYQVRRGAGPVCPNPAEPPLFMPQVLSGPGPVDQNPPEPPLFVHQVLSGPGPVDQNPPEPPSFMNRFLSGASPAVYQNPSEPPSFLSQVPSGAGPAVYQNLAEPTSSLYQFSSGASPAVYQNPSEPPSFLSQVPSGAGPAVYQNPPEPPSFPSQVPSGAGPAVYQNLAEPTSSLYQFSSGPGPAVYQNPPEPPSFPSQVPSGAGPAVYQNLAEPTSSLYQFPSGAGPAVYQNPSEPPLFLSRVSSGREPDHHNIAKRRQHNRGISREWNELQGLNDEENDSPLTE